MKIIAAALCLTLSLISPPLPAHGQPLVQVAKQALRAAGSNAIPLAIGAAGGAVLWSEVQKNGSYEGQNTVYSIRFETMKGQGYLGFFFGTRIIGKPDVFLVLEIEGVGRYVVPHLSKDYAGQLIQETLLMKEISAGRKVLVHVYDDRANSNRFWSKILSQSAEYETKAGVLATVGGKKARVPFELDAYGEVRLKGRLQLVSEQVEIVRPTWICSAEFTVPKRDIKVLPGDRFLGIPIARDKKVVHPWIANADFKNGGESVGTISLSMIEVRQ
jgi:hypothetical protein